MKKILLASLLSGLTMIGANASAQVTSNFQTTSTLESKCVISAQDISFGSIDVLTHNGNALGGISVLCSKGVSYVITPEGGYGTSLLTGSYQILNGTNGNTDGLIVLLNKGGITSAWNSAQAWSRNTTGVISSTGTGENQEHTVGAYLNFNNGPKPMNSAYSNSNNYSASPDNYSLTVTALVTY